MDELQREIEAFEAQKPELLKHHLYKFVVFHHQQLVDSYDDFDTAAKDAMRRFGRGPFLIRQVGVTDKFTMPASVAFRPIHAPS